MLDLAARTAAAVDLAVDLDGFTGRFANLWDVLDVVRFHDRPVALRLAAVVGAVRTVHGGGGMTLFPLKAFSTAVATRNRFDLAGGGALI